MRAGREERRLSGKIDWVRLETLYVSGKMSLRELAKSEGVSLSTLSGVSAREEWSRKRTQHRDKIKARSLARAQARGVKKLDRMIRAVEKTADMAMKALEDKDQFRRYIVTEGTDGCLESTEKVFTKLDTRALKEYAAAMRDLSGMLREYYGLRIPAEELREQIAREKLELERMRTEAAIREGEAGDGEVTVRFAGETEEMSE